ncbi:peptidylprolyl isomerase [Psychroflexus aestuariivivens]|uniref:peptidylprolyl isomerase n=1 Tax=Psychroflexus aestuariivivens TaxID=1795040 RepID=UPI000FDA6518|nr:peptidylprolyl isomerase [Psychroflexus aestuariivivens]
MKQFFVFYALIFFCAINSFAQQNEQILFTIDSESYTVDSFLDSYQKNIELVENDDNSISDYLELYVNFRLKLKAAYDQKLDTLPEFQKEYQNYFKQIADNYISNGEVTEKMIAETYERYKTEVRARHILFKISEHEEDTIQIYKKAKSVKKRIENGEDFEKLAKEFSEDPSVKVNGGDMNWFNAFKMVYPFENATYNLEVDEISEPVRTQFGYHIIQKTGERKSRGEISTAHILVFENDSLSDPKSLIDKIYKKLESGEDFHELAKQYSHDTNTGKTGGYIPAFKVGGLNSKTFENKAFALQNPGDYTEPFKTKFGWHIAKLIEVKPLEPLAEVEREIRRQLKTSSRSKLLNSRIQSNIEKNYDIEINPNARNYFLNQLDDSFKKGKWKFLTESNIPEEYFLKIDDYQVGFQEFGEYLQKKQRMLGKMPNFEVIVDESIDEFVYKELIDYHKTQLMDLDESFAKKIMEYKNGILIFDFMKKNVWQPISEDSLKQKEYYENHREEFKSDAKIKTLIVTSSERSNLRKVKKALKNNQDITELNDEILENIIQENLTLKLNSSKLPEDLKLKTGLSKIYKHNKQFLLLNIEEILPSKILEFEKVKGKVINQLQTEREKELIENLRNQYNVEVNEEVLKQIEQ